MLLLLITRIIKGEDASTEISQFLLCALMKQKRQKSWITSPSPHMSYSTVDFMAEKVTQLFAVGQQHFTIYG